jgi:hypothetical protein
MGVTISERIPDCRQRIFVVATIDPLAPVLLPFVRIHHDACGPAGRGVAEAFRDYMGASLFAPGDEDPYAPDRRDFRK